MLLAGPHISRDLDLVVVYIGLLCREIFIRNFFVRTFILDDSLKSIRKLIMSYRHDPNNIQRIRNKLNNASRDIILLNEVLEYLKESLEEMAIPNLPPEDDESGRRLYKVLDCANMKRDTAMRCTDLVKLIEGAKNQLMTLQQMTDVINTKQLEDVFKNVEANTKFLVDASAANERSSASLDVMQIILAGSFAFDILDRLSGGTLNIVVPTWVDDLIVKPIISIPMAWWVLPRSALLHPLLPLTDELTFFFRWIVNMTWLAFVSVNLRWLMSSLNAAASGFMTLRIKINKKANISKLASYLKLKAIKVADSNHESETQLKKVAWTEEDAELWQGAAPDIEVLYDEKFGFLLSVFFQIDSKKTSLVSHGPETPKCILLYRCGGVAVLKTLLAVTTRFKLSLTLGNNRTGAAGRRPPKGFLGTTA